MATFSASIENVEINMNTLDFELHGNDEYGLEKSIVNSLRRTLLSEIPSVAFRVEEGSQKDIIMEVNNTSLHNEFLLHRLSLIPLYIDPETYEHQYLFYLHVKHDIPHPYKFVTTDDIKIYPRKEGVPLSETMDIDNYDLQKPLSKHEHKDIFRPFVFRGKEYPVLITELKATYTEDTFQELKCYGVPSVSDAREHARWKSCSDALYTFLKDEDLFMKVATDKAGINKILDEEEHHAFIESLRLSESERYYYRDIHNEPNRYTFRIASIHHYSSKQLFMVATEVMVNKLDILKQHFINMVSGGTTTIIVEPHINENNYHFKLCGQNDTIGNVLQSHIVNHFINDGSMVNFCGYKKSHPLEEYINLYIGLNPQHIICKSSDELKLNSLVKFMDNVIEELLTIYRDIGKEAMRAL
jgi:DNA-directed RNA polymerase subunit L